jgi:hypothetical protein
MDIQDSPLKFAQEIHDVVFTSILDICFKNATNNLERKAPIVV